MSPHQFIIMDVNMELECKACDYYAECSKRFGPLEDEENCSAVIGTHFCLASWANITCPKDK